MLTLSLFKRNFPFFILIFLSFSVFAQNGKINLDKKHQALTRKIRDFKSSDSAWVYADSLHVQADQLKDTKWKTQIYLAQSYYAYSLGDFSDALEFGKKATAIALPADSVSFVKAPLMVAYMLDKVGKDNAALEIAFRTLRFTEQHHWKKLTMDCNTCIADIYRSMNLSARAMVYAKQAYGIAKELKDTTDYLTAISTLSNVYSNRDIRTPENMAKATELYEIIVSEPYFSTFSDFSKARHLSNMGRLYQMDNRQEAAEKALIRSIALSRKGDFKNLEASALNELMTLKIDQQHYREAMGYGHRALTLIGGKGSTSTLERDIYNHLTEGYVQLKDFEKAYNFSEKSRVINDSLAATDKAELAEKMDQDYRANKSVLQSDANARLMKQQRNFISLIGLIIIIGLLLIYAWFVNKRKKKAAQMEAERQQLEKLNALKAKFFSNISHELRTPLTLILGPVEQLRNDKQQPLDPMLKQNYIETVWQNSKKLTRLVNELLDLGKMESSTLSLYPQTVSLHSFIKVVYQGFSSAADFKKLRYELDCDIPWGLAANIDRDKLEKILNNLISNALKFTPGGGIVSIRASAIASGLTITVADTGRGIPQGDLDFVFDRYYQVAADHNVAEGGTGIGLSLAKEYTELMGGKIKIKSTTGEGTVFNVFLPLTFEEIPETEEHAGAIAWGAEAYIPVNLQVAQQAKGFILLVEDQVEMADYISSILRPYHVVKIASNGFDALKLMEESQVIPSLIISDVMMPEMDGFELLNRLKSHEVFCRVPVIMLTALADSANKLTALHIGVDDYLTKPFLSTELLARSINLINNAAARSAYIAGEGERLALSLSTEEEIMTVSPADLKWLKQLEAKIQTDISKVAFDLSTLSSSVAVSERQLFRNIKRITGLTPNKYIRSVRLRMAREAIESGNYKTVAEISYVAGFETPAYFSRLFKEEFGTNVADLL